MTRTFVSRSIGNFLWAALFVAGAMAFADGKPVAPDNTANNAPANSPQGQKPTADQAKNNQSDVDIAAKIRRSVMADKALSTSAHNVKIIVESGVVTLKGPVKSAGEKSTIETKAVAVVGAKNVQNQIEIAP